MPGFTFITGNRLEYLAEKCAADLGNNPPPPMTDEVISVQSMGMMKWLSFQLALNTGICTNCSYLFPNRLASMLLNSFFPGSGNERYFDRDSVPWKIMKIIISHRDDPLLGRLSVYAGNDGTGFRLYQLASKICDVFDQYITFRPEMILEWDRGKDNGDWQPHLWRLLTSDISGNHPPELLYRLYSMIGKEGFVPGGPLPSRITLFGISYLPLYHINLLRAASYFCDVRLYMLNPSEKYWGDILRSKEVSRIISSLPLPPSDPGSELHLDTGNPLLASMGRPGRDFLRQIFSFDCTTEESFSEPDGSSLLNMIQRDIYLMEDRAVTGRKFTVDGIREDTSIVINSCHSPMREAEVLRDYILEIFNNDGSLHPSDVIVMAPDIDIYSGYIESVFGSGEDGISIPFRLADRKLAGTEPSVRAFFEVLDGAEGRFTASWALSLLDCDDIMRHFGFTARDVEMITSWVSRSGIRWGADAGFKRDLGLPGFAENTFRAGTDRLITGYLVDGEEMCMGVMPACDIEGGDSILLGKFITFTTILSGIYERASALHTLSEWADIFMFVLDSLFSTEEGIPGPLAPLSDTASLMRNVQESSGFDGTVGLTAVREFTESVIGSPSSARDFISGGITFCRMLPMRSIPFRVVCLLGMDARSFPGRSRPASFDLCYAEPKSGDRSSRDEDRYMFLETLISARERLYISYTGQNIINNTVNDPSPVVSELVDYIGSFIADPGDTDIKKTVIIPHRLQRHNPVYFSEGSGFFSYSRRGCADAELTSGNFAAAPEHFIRSLKPAAGLDERLTADELAWFLRNPARALCVKRLGINLDIHDETPDDDEPFSLDSADRRVLEGSIFRTIAGGGDPARLYDLARSEMVLPHGSPGVVVFEESVKNVKNFFSAFGGLFVSPRPDVDTEVEAGGIRISCTADGMYKDGRVIPCMKEPSAIDVLKAWTCHLCLCVSGYEGRSLICYGMFKKGEYRAGSMGWGHVQNAQEILSGLARLYAEGMVSPVELFPRSSYAFAKSFYTGRKGEPMQRGMSAAYKKFFDYRYPETADPWINRVFGSRYVPGREFGRVAIEVYGPLFENMTGGEEE